MLIAGRTVRLSALTACLAFAITLTAGGQTQQIATATAGTTEQTAPTPPGTPTLQVTAREVLLDVLVTDSQGQPVTGLKASDFNVTEEGQAQVIRRVEEHHAMTAAKMSKLASVPALPANTFSNYTPVRNSDSSIVLLLDSMDSPMGAQMAVRQNLIDFLKHMQPGPPVAIFQLDTEMRLIQGFTSDPKVLLAAVESKRDLPTTFKPTAAPPSYTEGALYRRTLMSTLHNGMEMLGRYLAAFPGRKSLVWFTGQVPMTIMGGGFGDPFRDGLTVTGDAKELTDVLTVSRIAVYPVDTRGMAVPRSMTAAAAHSGTMDGWLMGNFASLNNHANMDDVAAQTGGKAYYNTNDLTRVIQDVIRTGSNYYTLAYGTSNTKWNGEFRRIKVAVDRPDMQLQYKNGYYAYSLDKPKKWEKATADKRRAAASAEQPESGPTPANAQAASAGNAELGATIPHSSAGGFRVAMALGAIQPTEIVFAARIQPDANTEKLRKHAALPPDNFLSPAWQHKPLRSYTIFFDADLHKVRFSQTPDGMRHGSIDFVALVYTDQGEDVNSIVATNEIDVTAEQYRELLVSGLHDKEEIAIPIKGNYFLRLGVNDKLGDQMGALEIPVDQVRLDAAAKPQAQ